MKKTITVSEAFSELGIQSWANIAKRMTERSADTKTWRIRNKASLALREIAKDLLTGRGYIIATESEILTQYGEFFRIKFRICDNRKRIWAVHQSTPNSSGKVELSIVCVR